jgi:hypothetical protein
MPKFLTVLRYVGTFFLSALFFFMLIVQSDDNISRILEVEHMVTPLWLLQHRYGFVFLLSPFLLSLAVGLFLLSMDRTDIYAMFQSANLLRLRIAGSCLWMAYITALSEPRLYGWLSHTEMPSNSSFNDMYLILLAALGAWLSTLSDQSGKLFKHAKKLRSELDDIV